MAARARRKDCRRAFSPTVNARERAALAGQAGNRCCCHEFFSQPTRQTQYRDCLMTRDLISGDRTRGQENSRLGRVPHQSHPPKNGYAVAEAAARRGAHVILVSGPLHWRRRGRGTH